MTPGPVQNHVVVVGAYEIDVATQLRVARCEQLRTFSACLGSRLLCDSNPNSGTFARIHTPLLLDPQHSSSQYNIPEQTKVVPRRENSYKVGSSEISLKKLSFRYFRFYDAIHNRFET